MALSTTDLTHSSEACQLGKKVKQLNLRLTLSIFSSHSLLDWSSAMKAWCLSHLLCRFLASSYDMSCAVSIFSFIHRDSCGHTQQKEESLSNRRRIDARRCSSKACERLLKIHQLVYKHMKSPNFVPIASAYQYVLESSLTSKFSRLAKTCLANCLALYKLHV